MKYATFTVRGQGRANNEDCLRVLPEAGLFMVADGMGGHLAGEVASQIAVEAVADYLLQNSGQPPEVRLRNAIADANSKIYADSLSRKEHRNMGSTIALVWQQQDRVYLAHIGDSRIYHFNHEQARQLTHDHSLVGQMLREGVITPEQAFRHPQKNALTRALGVEAKARPDLQVFELPLPGFLLICTDGLSAYLPMMQVLPQVAAKVHSEQMLPVLAELAKEAGSKDDITCVLLWQEKGGGSVE